MRTRDVEARAALCSVLARGLLTLSEAADFAGVSYHLARYWARDVRYREIRAHVARRAWRKALKLGDDAGVRDAARKCKACGSWLA